MDLELLKNFVAVVEAGSFTAASKATSVPKSTVSRRLQEFEESLHIKLLERSTRSLRLTSDGALLFDRARHLITEAIELEHILRDREKTPRGHLRVAVPVLLGQLFLGKVAGLYASAWADTTLEIRLSDRQVDLIEEDFDCAIRIGVLGDSTLVSQVIAETHHILVSVPDAVSRSINKPEDIYKMSSVQFTLANERTKWQLNNDRQSIVIAPAPNIQIANMLAVRDACLAGGGIAFLPQFLVKHYIENGQLMHILPAWRGPKVQVQLIYPSRRLLSARVKAFKDSLLQVFKERKIPNVK